MKGGWAAHSESSEETNKHNIAGAFFTTMRPLKEKVAEIEKDEDDEEEEQKKVPENDGALMYGWITAALATTLIAF